MDTLIEIADSKNTLSLNTLTEIAELKSPLILLNTLTEIAD